MKTASSKKMRHIFMAIILLLATQMQSQEAEFLLRGTVTQSDGQQVLSDCNVTIVGVSGLGAATNRNGEFAILLPQELREGFTLACSYLGYERMTVEVSAKRIRAELQDDVLLIDIALSNKAFSIDPFEISSERIPEVVYSSPRHSVSDFELIGESILLLTYEKTLRKAARLYLVDKEMQHLDSIVLPLKIEAQDLSRDYAGRIYLESRKDLFHIQINDAKIDLERVDMKAFKEQIAPVVDTVENRLYFSTWMERFPAFDYFSFNREDSSYNKLRQVADEFMLELCRAEYKYLNTRDKLKLWRMELETGIEKEVLACVSTFEEGLYYDPIYAPMFIYQDSIYIFDHYNNMLYVHDENEVPIDSVSISYHTPGKVMSNYFTEMLVMDERSGKVYAIFQKPGGRCELHEIDKHTGDVLEINSLSYDYPSGIQVHEGEVFYTYRPFESMQKRYLYSEIIR